MPINAANANEVAGLEFQAAFHGFRRPLSYFFTMNIQLKGDYNL